MSIRKHQVRRFSVRWLAFSRKYWTAWEIKSAAAKAEEYAEYFSRGNV